MSTLETVQEVVRQDIAEKSRVYEELEDLYPYVCKIVEKRIGDVPDWEDVVQEVYRTSLSSVSRGKFRGESSVKTWVYRIIVRRVADYLRSLYRRKECSFIEGFDVACLSPTPDVIYERKELLRIYKLDWLVSEVL